MNETGNSGANPTAKLRVLWNEQEVQRRVSEMAEEIGRTLHGERLVCLVVLSGGFYFAADLTRRLSHHSGLSIEFIRLKSYVGRESTGQVELLGILPDVDNQHVLVLEDLMDTGLTLAHLNKMLKLAGAKSVKYAILVDKPVRRKHEFTPDFIGFHCDADAYLVGCGMDLRGAMRELPYIAAVEAE